MQVADRIFQFGYNITGVIKLQAGRISLSGVSYGDEQRLVWSDDLEYAREYRRGDIAIQK